MLIDVRFLVFIFPELLYSCLLQSYSFSIAPPIDSQFVPAGTQVRIAYCLRAGNHIR